MEVRRTVPVKLDVADSDADLLHETISEFLWAANYVVDHAWQGDYKTTSKAELQRETYDEVRAETRLQANLVQNARNKAAEAVKGVVARWKQGDYAGKPHFSTPTLVYDKRCATFNDDHATLSTVEGRITAEYVLPDESHETPHSEYLSNDNYEVTGAELHYRDGEFYLHVRTKADVDAPEQPENGTILGVDLGIENLAVTSTGTFWTGDGLDHWRTEYVERRRSLQECGTRWAHENVSYKAEVRGISVEQVNPRYTSQRCSTCGFTVEANRPSQDSFCCQSCGYQNHADYNAAKNIGLKLLRSQIGTEGGAPVGVRLNSGMLNTSGLTSAPTGLV